MRNVWLLYSCSYFSTRPDHSLPELTTFASPEVPSFRSDMAFFHDRHEKQLIWDLEFPRGVTRWRAELLKCFRLFVTGFSPHIVTTCGVVQAIVLEVCPPTTGFRLLHVQTPQMGKHSWHKHEFAFIGWGNKRRFRKCICTRRLNSIKTVKGLFEMSSLQSNDIFLTCCLKKEFKGGKAF